MKTRSSHQRCFGKKNVLKNFARFTGKHLCGDFQSTFSIEHLVSDSGKLWEDFFVIWTEPHYSLIRN